MKKSTTSAAAVPATIVEDAWQEVGASFERFCLTAGIATLARMMEEDADGLCGPRYVHADGKDGQRWGKTMGKVGFHGGKVEIERPRVRVRGGGEATLPSWEAALSEDPLGKWALNLMLINVSTRKFRRAVRLPGGDVPAPKGSGVSKSAVSRRFVALSAARHSAKALRPKAGHLPDRGGTRYIALYSRAVDLDGATRPCATGACCPNRSAGVRTDRPSLRRCPSRRRRPCRLFGKGAEAADHAPHVEHGGRAARLVGRAGRPTGRFTLPDTNREVAQPRRTRAPTCQIRRNRRP